MIKNIRVKNFVHFYEEQTLSFDEGGPYFFVGENGSGKTCMLEAIRRCMSSSKNIGASSSHEPKEDSMVLCKFDIPDKMVAISGVLYFGNDKTPRINGHGAFVKFVCVEKQQRSDQENRYDLYVDFLKKDANNWAVNEEIGFDQNAKEEFGKCLFENDCENLSECVNKHIVENRKLEKFSQRDGLSYSPGTECEKFLLEEIDERVVITFLVHGVTSVQWTMSKSFKREPGITQDYRQTANKQIKERSEIVSWYFGLTNGDVSEEEKKTVDLYFKKITNNDQIGFKIINPEADREIVFVDQGEHIRMDKCPEGYFEAMNWSIMLAINKFKTICLDEASKCMHHQMIKRMRDLVLKGIEGKVVIATTHAPTFFMSLTLPRTFIFRRQVINKKESTFAVISSKSIIEDVDKSSMIFQRHEFSTLFFAQRVMFVEGNSDLKVLEALKSLIVDDTDFMKEIIDKFGQDLISPEQFYHFVSSLHLIPLNGHMDKMKFHKVCKKLTLEHYLILDLNAVIEKDSAEKFLEDFDIGIDDESNILADVSCLEEKSILVWSSGNIEDALETLEEKVGRYLRAKEDDQQTSALPVTKIAKKTMKLFSSDSNLHDGNLMEFARDVLEGCLANRDADFCRLLHFLLKYASVPTHDKAVQIYSRLCNE